MNPKKQILHPKGSQGTRCYCVYCKNDRGWNPAAKKQTNCKSCGSNEVIVEIDGKIVGHYK